jgi:hypothetical protein
MTVVSYPTEVHEQCLTQKSQTNVFKYSSDPNNLPLPISTTLTTLRLMIPY